MQRPSPQILTLAATVLGSSLAFIDATVVVVALPTIERDLDLGLAGQQWVVLSYSLALAALYLVGGAVGDRRGRREVFVVGTVGFAAASIVAGAAPNEEVLIVGRTLQGITGAFLTTNSLALLRGVFGDESGRAIGLWTAWTSVATVAGPPAGGALVEWVSWRWIFFLNIPLAALTVALALLGRCEERADRGTRPLDIPGAVLCAAGFAALTYALVEGAERGFADVWWALAVAAATLGAFGVVEARVAEPMLPFSLFKRRLFAVANLETFVVYGALGGVLFVLFIYLQFLGFTPFESGLLSVPLSVVLILLSTRFGALAGTHGPRLFLTVGPTLVGLGCLLFALVDERSDFWVAGVAGMLVFAVGLAMIVAPITAAALAATPQAQAGIASGVNTTVSRLGNLLAVAVVGLVVSFVFDAQVSRSDAVPFARGQQAPELRDASVDAFRAAMLVCAGFAFVGAAIGGLGLPKAEVRGDEVSEPAPV